MLTQKRLKEVLCYNPETGDFIWLISKAKARKGNRAGTIDGLGYVQIGIDGKLYRAHRLAFLYVTGEFPKDQVDHKNMNCADNSWANLREATQAQNHANRLINRNNRSGHRGVYHHSQVDKWCANIRFSGRVKYLGIFATKEEAAAAYQAAAKENFGEFVRP